GPWEVRRAQVSRAAWSASTAPAGGTRTETPSANSAGSGRAGAGGLAGPHITPALTRRSRLGHAPARLGHPYTQAPAPGEHRHPLCLVSETQLGDALGRLRPPDHQAVSLGPHL